MNVAQTATTSFYGKGDTYSIAGGRPEGQAYLLDGTDIVNFFGHGSGAGSLGTSLGIDAIAEFQTLTNTYSAQFGGNGAVVNAVSKSGTNAFHGTAFEFLRNSALDARDFFRPCRIRRRLSAETSSAARLAVRSRKTSCSSFSTMKDCGSRWEWKTK